jgi:hypothetical protein
MSPAATKPNMVSRVTFNSALKNLIEGGPLAQTDNPDDRARLVINYLNAADRVLHESGAVRNTLTKATILQAFFDVFNETVDQTLLRDRALKVENLTETLAPLGAIDFDSYIGSTRPSRRRLVADMRSRLRQAPVVTGDML